MSEEKKPPPGAQGNLADLPPVHGEATGRVRLAVHEELEVGKSELFATMRRWWLIAVTVGGAVWWIAGYLGHKADAEDLDLVRNKVVDIGNRVTAMEQLRAIVERLDQRGERIEAQIYQMALRVGAVPIVQPGRPPLR